MKKSERRKAARKGVYVITALLVIAVAAVIIALAAASEDKKNSGSKTPSSKIVEPERNEEKITNFVIFGIDDVGYTAEDINRSDTIMIVSINENQNAIKLLSIMRDSKVEIKGYEPQKINGAYKYGGASLAIDTINDNFHLKLRNYITVNWAKMTELIDMIGGVDVEVTQDEADIINENNPDSEYIYEGTTHLDGAQALSFSRIRKIDSDYERVGRQHDVLNAVLHKMGSLGTSKSLDLLDPLMNVVETSFFYADLYDILAPLDMKNMTLSRYIVPSMESNPERFGGLDETSSWVWEFDIEKAADYINEVLAWK